MKLELLCGPIASGKSTYARKRAEEGAVIVNDDAIVLAVHAGDYKLYDEKLKPVYKTIETSMIMAALTAGRDVVVDRTCGEPETRMRYVSLAKAFGAWGECIVFPRQSPAIHAQRRVDHDARGMSYDQWLAVAQYHQSQFVEPELSEGFGIITRLAI